MALLTVRMSVAIFCAAAAWAAAPPAGLLLSEGAEVSRNSAAAVAAPAGEPLYPGDVVTARTAVRVLSCEDKRIATLPAGVQAQVESTGMKAERWEASRAVRACFLPAVKKGPVGGPRHLGAMMMRSLDDDAAGDRAARIKSLDETARAALLEQLALIEGDGPEMQVMRAAAFQRAGLHHDAREEFEAALKTWPGAVWLRTLAANAGDAARRAR